MADEQATHALAGKLAQLVGETILHIHPHVAALSEGERERFRTAFLEEIESHIAEHVGPLLDSVTSVATIPPEIANLIGQIRAPEAQVNGIISTFFEFGLMFTLAQAMLAPFVQSVQDDVWKANPVRPLSPADLATMTVRGIDWSTTSATAQIAANTTEAALSGMDAQRFQAMADTVGMAPALQLLFEMVRRGIIEEGALNGGGTTLVAGIQQSDVKDEWIDAVAKLRYIQPSPVDFVRAAVQAQMGYDEAKQWATTVGLEPAGWIGGNPDWFDLLYDTAGRPPGPQEVGRMANRGIVGWTGTGPTETTFAQAIAESDVKTKWTEALAKLEAYWPPNGEVRTLLMHGGISEAQATAYWRGNGVPADLAKAYLYIAQVEQVTQDKALAKGDIETLVQEQAISDAQATELLALVGYSGANAAAIISMAHYRYELEALRRTVGQISSLFTQHKATASQAKEALQAIGLPGEQVDSLMATLQIQRDNYAPVLTASQWANALYYQVVTQEVAQSAIEGLGYSPFDAWTLLSIRLHGPLPGQPVG